MAQQLAEVCTLLVEQNYGTLASHVFATLATHGGLTFPFLRLYSRLTPIQINHSLTTLLQHHLLFHFTDDDSPTRYQVDWRRAYFLVRSGRILSLVEERYGEGAAEIIANLLQLGHAKVGDLQDTYDFDIGSPRDSGVDLSEAHVNEEIDDDGYHHIDTTIKGRKISTLVQFHVAMRKLLAAGFLAKVGKTTYMTDTDLQEELELTALERYPDRKKPSSGKRKQEFDNLVKGLKRKQREEDEYDEKHDIAPPKSKKRSGEHVDDSSNKRIKLDNNEANAEVEHIDLEEDMGPKLSPDLVVQVNFDKCIVALRSQRLERLASLYLGESCGVVYAALLRTLESKVSAVKDDTKEFDDAGDEEAAQPTSSVPEIAAALPPDVDLTLSIKGAIDIRPTENASDGAGKNKRKAHVIEDSDDFSDIGIGVNKKIKQEHSDDEEADCSPAQVQIHGYTSYRDKNRRYRAIEEHLAILEEHPFVFCRKAGITGRSEWRVNFPQLATTIANIEFDNTVTACFGRISARVVRMLREKGKLDEKQVAQGCMMRIKEIRTVLNNLQEQGFLDYQELPKDNTRTPCRTIYLWHFDPQSVRRKLLHRTYQAMARCMSRMKVERRGTYKDVMDKAERLDVVGNEDRMLSKTEKAMIVTWTELEERLLTQIERCDEVVAAMRDYNGGDSSMSA